MKIISLVALLSSILLHAQKPDPPNGIHLKDNLYMDATEVANIHWLEFEHYIKRDSSEEFVNASLPSIEVTKNYRPEYYRQPSYRYYPVVGISYDQAMNFCQWRSDVVNLKLAQDGENWRVKYRLPTEEEWELAASFTDTLSNIKPRKILVESLLKSESRLVGDLFPEKVIYSKPLIREIFEYKKTKIPAYIVDFDKPWFITNEEKLPQSVYHFEKQQKKLKYTHMIGNVAEMIQEKGIVKGGSWRHIMATSFPAQRSKIDPEKVYDWVGFRCIGEMIVLED